MRAMAADERRQIMSQRQPSRTTPALPRFAAHPLFPLPHGIALAQDIPGARLLTLEHTGHELPPAVWDPVIPAILEHTAPTAGRLRPVREPVSAGRSP